MEQDAALGRTLKYLSERTTLSQTDKKLRACTRGRLARQVPSTTIARTGARRAGMCRTLSLVLSLVSHHVARAGRAGQRHRLFVANDMVVTTNLSARWPAGAKEIKPVRKQGTSSETQRGTASALSKLLQETENDVQEAHLGGVVCGRSKRGCAGKPEGDTRKGRR